MVVVDVLGRPFPTDCALPTLDFEQGVRLGSGNAVPPYEMIMTGSTM
jgi:hypothetical protein